MRKLIQHLGGAIVGASVPTLASQLFSLCLGLDTGKTEKAQEAFKCAQKSQEQKLEEEMDSEFEEVLDCHKDDQYNTSDLKDLEKFRQKKARKARNSAKEDWSSAPIPVPKRKAKAKAKSKMSFAEKLRFSLGKGKTSEAVAPPMPEAPAEPEAPAGPEVPVVEGPEGPPEPASSSDVPAARLTHRGPNIERTPEALAWPAPPGCSIGYSRVSDTMAWQAKLPPKVKFNVPYSRVAEQNTFYAQFDPASFGKHISPEEIAELNNLDLGDIIYYRKMVSAGTKKNLSSAEARCMCARWLQSWHSTQT